jgi:hypothetical protein
VRNVSFEKLATKGRRETYFRQPAKRLVVYPSGPTNDSNPKAGVLLKGLKGVDHPEGGWLEVVHGVFVSEWETSQNGLGQRKQVYCRVLPCR